ncbi:MAG: flagellar export chaperone FlgN [Lachnospiraceae bacterium]|nr:flagellar export chaperone FlgN [Lachnospiraceae bacterium]
MAETKGITYIRMMLDILSKKESQLTSLLELTTAQEQILKGEEFDEDAFTDIIAKKREHLSKIEEADNGFQAIYNRIAEEIQNNKEAYKEQILEMQGLITRVTDLGVKLSALEEKNKTALEANLQGKRQNIRQFKVSKQTADKYYKNMIGMQTGASYFMDQKK